ncbi:MAG: phage Gp37/Gp68 family protein [Acidobacteriaceae bacterium]
MASTTGIEWTDATWNPTRGCSRVSEGCRNCYAERVAHRFSGAGQPYEGLTQLVNGHPTWTGKVTLAEKHLLDPLRWRGKKLYHPAFEGSVGSMPGMRIFVNSMSDLFHENVPDEWIDHIFAVMALCPQHIFQVLTKRPERMLAYLSTQETRVRIGLEGLALCMEAVAAGKPFKETPKISVSDGEEGKLCVWPLPNVHPGVSVEDQKTADERIPLLLQTPAAVRFISAEPLLGAIDFRWAKWDDWSPNDRRVKQLPALERGGRLRAGCVDHYDGLRMLDWVIVGGESGPGARPMHPDWARSLRDQCVAAGVPFFFKQWGEWEIASHSNGHYDSSMDRNRAYWVFPDGAMQKPSSIRDGWNGGEPIGMIPVGKKAAGSLLDGREWKEFPR